MFADDDQSDHDRWVHRARVVAWRLELADISDAFLASLTSRRLDLRSALSSFVLARGLPKHRFKAQRNSARSCAVCNQESKSTTNLNVLNFERFKWGGVRKLKLSYVAFDLEQFENAPKIVPTDDDRKLWKSVVQTIQSMAPTTSAASLASSLGVLPGNKDERSSLIGTLGIVSVLETARHRGFLDTFVPETDRDWPARRFVDDPYPVSWWTRADGVNATALDRLGLSVV
jgi:hypothetical protein